jgi:hypothetical protein
VTNEMQAYMNYAGIRTETIEEQLIRINTQALENTLFDLVSVRDGHVNIDAVEMVQSVSKSLRAIADHLDGIAL